MFCVHCGKILEENAAFCTCCGKPVIQKKAVETTFEAVTEPVAETAETMVEVATETAETVETTAEVSTETVETTAETVTATQVVPVSPAEVQMKVEKPEPKGGERDLAIERHIFILSIVGAALAEIGIPGLIVTLVARNRLTSYLYQVKELHGKAKAAKFISLGGLIGSIVMAVLWTIWIFEIIVLIILYFGILFQYMGFWFNTFGA